MKGTSVRSLSWRATGLQTSKVFVRLIGQVSDGRAQTAALARWWGRSRLRRLPPWLALAWIVLVHVAFYRNMVGRFGDEFVGRIEGIFSGLGF